MLLGLENEIKKPKQPEYQARSRPPAWPSPRVPPPVAPGPLLGIVVRALLPAARRDGGPEGMQRSGPCGKACPPGIHGRGQERLDKILSQPKVNE